MHWYNIPILINNTAFHINTTVQHTVYKDLLVMQNMFYRITKYCAHYKIPVVFYYFSVNVH